VFILKVADSGLEYLGADLAREEELGNGKELEARRTEDLRSRGSRVPTLLTTPPLQ
jgi:hypothetical protein